MTHQEFLDRVKENLKVEERYYTNYVEPLYMMSTKDKDQFCKEFNKFGKMMIEDECSVFDDFACYYRNSEELKRRKNVELTVLEDEIKRLQHIMIANGLEERTNLPPRELIKIKLEMGFAIAPALTQDQLDYIKDNLQ